MRVQVHPRVHEKRPEVEPDDVEAAFVSTVAKAPRLDTRPVQWVGVGLDGKNRLLEYVAIETGRDEWLIFHAMPATTKVLLEIGLKRR